MEKVLVVIDYQNDFVNGSLGFKRAEELENGIYEKVISYLKDGHKVIFTYDSFRKLFRNKGGEEFTYFTL